MVPPSDMLDLSLNEVEQTTLKAARGAGLAWGVAEDVARSARWLAPRTPSWAPSLLALLRQHAAGSSDDAAAGASPPCVSPISLGEFIADGAAVRVGTGTERFAQVSRPLWLLPALASAAKHSGCHVAMAIGAIALHVAPNGTLSATEPLDAWASTPDGPVAVRFSSTPLDSLPYSLAARGSRAHAEAAVWRELEAFAERTYVPASEESRARGAGAGLLDQD